MKNKIYILGLTTIILISLSCLLKLWHLPGAGIILVSGFLLLCLMFIPFAFVSNYKADNVRSHKLLYVITALVLIIDFISTLFALMHWPGKNLLMFTIPLPFILILPVYLYYNRKENEIDYRNFLPIVFYFAYYAAITGLLALSVQKEIVDSYVFSAMRIEQQTNVLKLQCHALQNNFLLSKTIDKDKISFIKNVNTSSNNICNEADSIVAEIIMEQSQKDISIFLKNGKTDFFQIRKKEIPMEFTYENILSKIESDIINLKKIIHQYKGSDSSIANQLDVLLSMASVSENNWLPGFFRNRVIISGIEKLYLLKHQVKFIEYQVLSTIE